MLSFVLCGFPDRFRIDQGNWSNRTPAMIALWAASVYLARKHKNHLLTAVPATFMSAVTAAYFMAAGGCMGMLFPAKISKYRDMPALAE